MASPVPTNAFLGAGDAMNHLKMVAFVGAGHGLTRSYKSIFRGGWWHGPPLQMVPRKKIYNFFHKISDEVKFYTKIVEITRSKTL